MWRWRQVQWGGGRNWIGSRGQRRSTLCQGGLLSFKTSWRLVNLVCDTNSKNSMYVLHILIEPWFLFPFPPHHNNCCMMSGSHIIYILPQYTLEGNLDLSYCPVQSSHPDSAGDSLSLGLSTSSSSSTIQRWVDFNGHETGTSLFVDWSKFALHRELIRICLLCVCVWSSVRSGRWDWVNAGKKGTTSQPQTVRQQ